MTLEQRIKYVTEMCNQNPKPSNIKYLKKWLVKAKKKIKQGK
jgi:hypothetical protein